MIVLSQSLLQVVLADIPLSLTARRQIYEHLPASTANSTAMAPRPKTNAFFQTAIADPALKLTSHEQRVYRSVAQPIAPPPLSGSIKVVVSSHPATQRIWILPKALLVEHSNYFSNLVQDPTREEILLQDTLPSDFQNFVDFIHSSI